MIIAHLSAQPIPLGVTLSVIFAASTDLTARRVPNLLIAAGLVASLAAQLWLHGAQAGGLHWLAGVLTGFALLFPVYLLGGMAAGDVKLLMLVGGWLGADATLGVALFAGLIGGAWALAIVIVRGRLRTLCTNVVWLFGDMLHGSRGRGSLEHLPGGSVGTIPYAGAIAAGTLIVLYQSIQ
ncbi:Prepilin peptidase CpaA [Paraburkholderia tropica]|uniref:A24 family peptidase n=2 Tax=Burkholderiaceae TaxID=119060 RepID=UPI001CACD81C|nr:MULTISPECIES: prepilin peptidase [Paraburkholderia]CAG9211883.1 Prepilin peptidase CpaA [Paraburkholderia tropica]